MERNTVTCAGGVQVQVDIPAKKKILNKAAAQFCRVNCNRGENCFLRQPITEQPSNEPITEPSL